MFVGRAFRHDTMALISSGVLTPEGLEPLFPTACFAGITRGSRYLPLLPAQILDGPIAETATDFSEQRSRALVKGLPKFRAEMERANFLPLFRNSRAMFAVATVRPPYRRKMKSVFFIFLDTSMAVVIGSTQ